MPAPLIIDPQAIENLRALTPGDDDAFLREIVSIFLEDTPKRIAELEQSLAENDPPRFTRAAHSVKGSSSNLGAMALRSVAERLEQQSKQSGLTGVEPILAELKGDFARAAAELRQIVKL
jgi:HPt (histidine-containing phosphotransfer) domain-containing protein